MMLVPFVYSCSPTAVDSARHRRSNRLHWQPTLDNEVDVADITGSGSFHAVRFYKDAESLCGLVAGFLGDGFVAKQPAVMIATPEHRNGIVEQLRFRGFDPALLQASGELVLLDANESLNQFMVDGRPEGRRFAATIEPVLQAITARRPGVSIRAYGEMVDVLWKRGQTVAATRLEMLWNDLAQHHQFALLCGYAMGNFYKDAAVEEICSHHSHVLSPSGEPALLN